MEKKKVPLMLGALSEVGIRLMERLYEKYDTIYANYGTNRAGIDKLMNNLPSDECKVAPVQDAFPGEGAGEGILSEIRSLDVWPDHVRKCKAFKADIWRF